MAQARLDIWYSCVTDFDKISNPSVYYEVFIQKGRNDQPVENIINLSRKFRYQYSVCTAQSVG